MIGLFKDVGQNKCEEILFSWFHLTLEKSVSHAIRAVHKTHKEKKRVFPSDNHQVVGLDGFLAAVCKSLCINGHGETLLTSGVFIKQIPAATIFSFLKQRLNNHPSDTCCMRFITAPLLVHQM